MTSLTKNPHIPSKKFFFECRLEDLPRLLRLLLCLQSILDRRNSRKATAFRRFFSRKSPKAAGRQRVKVTYRCLELICLQLIIPFARNKMQKVFLVRFKYSHCCVSDAAFRLLYRSSFDPRSNLSLRPLFLTNAQRTDTSVTDKHGKKCYAQNIMILFII